MTKPLTHCFKYHFIVLLAATGLAVSARADSPGTKTPSLAGELRPIIDRVQAKSQNAAITEKDLAAELQDLDALMAKHKGETGDQSAQILFTKAHIYSEVLRDQKTYAQIAGQIQHDYPDSKPAAALKRQEESDQIRAKLVAGVVFPDFNRPDISGQARSISAYKGKILLVDFWATWCGPCVHELPNVQHVYEKYHDQGFEVLSISFDKAPEKLKDYIEEHKLLWPQILDGENHPLGAQYGVVAIPTTFLIDREGKLITKNVRGEALEKAVVEALAK